MHRTLPIIALLCVLGCDDAGTDAPTDGDAAPSDATVEVDLTALGIAWLADLPGLWTGPAGQTPLGDFPVMNMDVRAADDRTLFSRFDLDPEDGLRFAFAVEDVAGSPTVVYRNGGFFLGLLRDTRTVLIEADDETLRFCHRERGCDYLDARWHRPDDDRIELSVDVRGMRHVQWAARRVEARDTPDAFAFTTGPHDGPFPPMPSLDVTVTWDEPLPGPTPVWLLVSTVPCGLSGMCTPARIMSGEAPEGATEFTLRIDQIHAGPVVVNAVLDRDGDFRQRQFPTTGDGLAGLDRQVTIADDGPTEVVAPVLIRVP